MLSASPLLALHALLLTAAALALPGCGMRTQRCQNPTPIQDQTGAPTGYEKCADGAILRVEALPGDPTIDKPGCAGTEAELLCKSDADCTAGPHGKCHSYTGVTGSSPPPLPATMTTICACLYACATDDECASDEACLPSPIDGLARCIPATCKTGDDCSSGECFVFHTCYGGLALACSDEHPAQDAIKNPSGCPTP
jgi:hypothetical protein